MKRNKKPSHTSGLPALLACLIFACMLGCESKTQSKLIGTWVIDDVDSVLEQVNQNSSPSDAESDSSNGSSPQMTITFKANGTLETATLLGQLNVKKEGVWKIISNQDSDSELTNMKIGCELADQVTQHDIEWVDENSIRFAPPNMAGVDQTFTFHRK